MVGDYYYTDEHLGGGGGKANPLFLSLYHEPLIKTTRTKYKIIHQHIFNYNNNYCYIIYLYQEYNNEKTKGWSMQLLQKIIKKQNRIELLCLKYFTIPITHGYHVTVSFATSTYSPFLISATISFLTFACSLHLVSLMDQPPYSQRMKGLAWSIALSHDNPCEIIAICLL